VSLRIPDESSEKSLVASRRARDQHGSNVERLGISEYDFVVVVCTLQHMKGAEAWHILSDIPVTFRVTIPKMLVRGSVDGTASPLPASCTWERLSDMSRSRVKCTPLAFEYDHGTVGWFDRPLTCSRAVLDTQVCKDRLSRRTARRTWRLTSCHPRTVLFWFQLHEGLHEWPEDSTDHSFTLR
jgi:hypothetical protein